jgi:hypothetical protein
VTLFQANAKKKEAKKKGRSYNKKLMIKYW